jgi:DNA topoisomerase III
MHRGGGGGTIRVVNVAEKPSVAEIPSRRSGGMQPRPGRSSYNRIFEFNYAIGGQACHMLVTFITGHLMELEFEERFRRRWHSCDPADLFQAPVRKFMPQACRSRVPPNSWWARPCGLRMEASRVDV